MQTGYFRIRTQFGFTMSFMGCEIQNSAQIWNPIGMTKQLMQKVGIAHPQVSFLPRSFRFRIRNTKGKTGKVVIVLPIV